MYARITANPGVAQFLWPDGREAEGMEKIENEQRRNGDTETSYSDTLSVGAADEDDLRAISDNPTAGRGNDNNGLSDRPTKRRSERVKIPPDATIDSVGSGNGITFRWRWPKRDKDGRKIRNGRGKIIRDCRYLKWISYEDHWVFKQYYRTKEQFYEQAQEWERAARDNNNAGRDTAGDSFSNGVD